MNFLAHLHIAHHCQSSLLGNLLGDFVKGDPTEQYPQSLVQGIRLHRWVDAYTDSHPVMKAAKSLFPSQQQRFAPIASTVLGSLFSQYLVELACRALGAVSDSCTTRDSRRKYIGAA